MSGASKDHAPFPPPAGKISKQHSCARKGLYVFLDGTAAFGEARATAGHTVSTAREFGGSSQMPPASASPDPQTTALAAGAPR
jgi:hypothetical protein